MNLFRITQLEKVEAMYERNIKPLIDIFFSIILISIVSVPVAIIALIISFNYKENPFYIAVRAGKHEENFLIFKLKTMRTIYDENGQLLDDNQRITKLGESLRKLSIDELPQLLNIAKGDMSFIGPRPLTDEYIPLYTANEKRRLNVKPGISGWAQINGRNLINWEEKFKLDLYYVENISFFLDVKILFLTVVKVITQEGVKEDGYVNTKRFTGKKDK